jgi:hypothetical protein
MLPKLGLAMNQLSFVPWQLNFVFSFLNGYAIIPQILKNNIQQTNEKPSSPGCRQHQHHRFKTFKNNQKPTCMPMTLSGIISIDTKVLATRGACF